MDPARFLVRRATVDDLSGLKLLWERSGLQVLDLERRLTEFQLVVSHEGDLAGAVGLHLEGRQGLIHSEAFAQPEDEDDYRRLLWDRLKNLSRNHGLTHLWTQEQAPFWHQAAHLKPADRGVTEKLPPTFGNPHGHWSVLILRDESVESNTLEREFELFQQASRTGLEEVMGKTQRLRTAAYVVASLLFLGLFSTMFYLIVRWVQTSRATTVRPR